MYHCFPQALLILVTNSTYLLLASNGPSVGIARRMQVPMERVWLPHDTSFTRIQDGLRCSAVARNIVLSC